MYVFPFMIKVNSTLCMFKDGLILHILPIEMSFEKSLFIDLLQEQSDRKFILYRKKLPGLKNCV